MRGYSSDNRMRILIDNIQNQGDGSRAKTRASLVYSKGAFSNNDSTNLSTNSYVTDANMSQRYLHLKQKYEQVQVKYEEKKLEVCQLQFRLKEIEGIKETV